MTSADVIASTGTFPNGADDQVYGIAVPFDVIIYDDTLKLADVDQVSFNTNGVMRMDAAIGAYDRTPAIPSTNYGQFISFGGDSDGEFSGDILSMVRGTAPNRVWTIQFTYYTHYSTSTAYGADIQVSFYEATKEIELSYFNIVGSTNGASECGLNAGDGAYGSDIGAFPTSETCYLFTEPSAPVFAANPIAKDFGNLQIGLTSGAQEFRIFNQGVGTLNITSVSLQGIAGGEFILADANSYPLDLTTNEIFINATFSPTSVGTKTDTVEIVANGEMHKIPLDGIGIDIIVNSFPFTEGFEISVPPTDWTEEVVTLVGSTPDWTWETAGTSPTCSPQEGTHMAKFNSFNCSSGSEARLATPPLDLSALSTDGAISFWMYHDPGYSSNTNEGVQIQFSTDGTTWTDAPSGFFGRYSATEGWVKHKIYLSSVAGQTIFIGFLGKSQYGNNVFIDNVEVRELSSENDITNYSFPLQTGPALIDNIGKQVNIEVAMGTDVTTLVSDFTLSDDATASIGATPQISNTTTNDFTSPVIYTVTAEDGTPQDWQINVSVATTQSSENNILSYSLPDEISSATINESSHTIDVEIAYNADITQQIATFSISTLASVNIAGTNQESSITLNDFTNPVTYTVVAEDGTPQDWIITVTHEDVTVTAPWTEDFENVGNLPHGWTNDSGDDFDWSFGISTPSSPTGASADHTTGTSYFAYTEASGNNNMNAYLTTPPINIDALITPTLTFWYHMFGSTMGELHIDIYANSTWDMDAFTISGDQGDVWNEEIVDLSTYTGLGSIKIRFRGRTGTDYYSDICIDDVKVSCLEPSIPTLTADPATICSGDLSSLTISGNLNDATNWQIYTTSCGVDNIGQTSTGSFDANPTTTTTYYIRGEGACGTLGNCEPVTVTVNPATNITSQPNSNTSICEGGADVTLSALGDGTGTITYQWYNTAGAIVGETNSDLTITSLPANSDTYYCIIGSDCGTDVQSDNAIVTINPATAVVTEPAAITTTCEGDADITLSALGSGTGTITYQWYYGAGLIVGETNADIIITSLPENSDTYYCIVGSDCGVNVQTADAVVTINPATTVVTNPTATTTAYEDDADITLSALGSGTGTITYQWYNTAGAIVGETTTDLTITTEPTNSDTYYCIIGSDCGVNVQTTDAIITINPATAIVTEPAANTSACEGDTDITLSTLGDGTGTITYQWYNGTGLIVGETNTDLIIPTLAENSDTYYCIVGSNHGADVQTTNAVVTINSNTTIDFEPEANTTVCEGEDDITLFIIATGAGTITYQWYNATGIITGENSAVLIIPTTSANSDTYYCIVGSDCSDVQSADAIVTINPTTDIDTEPAANTTACEGDDDITLSVLGSGTGIITYQWHNTSGIIDGETMPDLTITTDPTNSDTYYCIIGSDCGTDIQSEDAVVTIGSNTEITTQPISQSIELGTPASFTVGALGSNLNYQWRKDEVNIVDNTNISGSQTNELSISATTMSDDGMYDCVVTGNCGEMTSNVATLSITTGIVDFTYNKISIYPNPTENIINIELNSISNGKISLKDILGRVVYSSNIIGTTHSINMVDYRSGVYFITIIQGNESQSFKVVKK